MTPATVADTDSESVAVLRLMVRVSFIGSQPPAEFVEKVRVQDPTPVRGVTTPLAIEQPADVEIWTADLLAAVAVTTATWPNLTSVGCPCAMAVAVTPAACGGAPTAIVAVRESGLLVRLTVLVSVAAL